MANSITNQTNILSKEYDKKWEECGTIKKIIMGSMPGTESIGKKIYYVSNKNSFWKIMDGIFIGDDYQNMIDGCKNGNLDFVEVIKKLMTRGIALFDMLDSCDRKDSSDSSIKNGKQNKYLEKVLKDKTIKVFCNGKKAMKLFKSKFPNFNGEITCLWSSANCCSKPFDCKMYQWKVLEK